MKFVSIDNNSVRMSHINCVIDMMSHSDVDGNANSVVRFISQVINV